MSGFNVVPYTVALQRKLSFPFVTVVMSLLAVPFAVTTGRRGALYGVGLGIVLAIAYWLLFSLFAAIGTASLIAPMLAASGSSTSCSPSARPISCSRCARNRGQLSAFSRQLSAVSSQLSAFRSQLSAVSYQPAGPQDMWIASADG